MEAKDVSRRDFLWKLSAGASAAWVAAQWPAILAAHEHARNAAAGPPPALEFFQPEQAAEIEAMAAQIIPTDDTPGAREARVIYFIDRALVTFEKDKQEPYTAGLKQLASKAAEMFPGHSRFSALNGEQQIAVLTAIEKSDFFGLVRTHTVMGFLCDPARGGNYNEAGWKLLGFENQHVWKPPFGFYDRDYPGWEASNKPGAER